MELWHLDYRKSVERGVDEHFSLTMSQGGDKAALAASEAFRAGLYDKIALVDEAISPGRLFHLTQHLEEAWTENPAEGITVVGFGPIRSTSNGDVLVTKDGHFIMTSGGLEKFAP